MSCDEGVSVKKIRVCKISELTEDHPRSLKILAREVMVYRLGDEIFAREGACKHMGAALAKVGRWKGARLACSWHGWEYDLRTGECVGKPGVCLRPYEVEVTGDEIFLRVDG